MRQLVTLKQQALEVPGISERCPAARRDGNDKKYALLEAGAPSFFPLAAVLKLAVPVAHLLRGSL
jgi:hypothetical protein